MIDGGAHGRHNNDDSWNVGRQLVLGKLQKVF